MKDPEPDAGTGAAKRGDFLTRAFQKLASAARILLIPMVIVVYVAVMIVNLNEADRRSLRLQHESDAADRINVTMKIVSLNVARAEVTARMQIGLAGNIAKDEFTPAVNLRVLVNAVNGQQSYEFQRGVRVAPIEAVFALSGEENLYPFDTYTSTLAFWVAKPGPVAKPPPPPPPAPVKRKSFFERLTKSDEPETVEKPPAQDTLVGTSALASQTSVPVSLNLSASIPGFKFEGVTERSTIDDVTRIQLTVRRADTVIVTSMGIQVMMLCLSFSMLAMVLFGTIRGKESALAPLSISATLIFGLPALRDTQPGVPPLGVFSDFASYLWAELIVAVSTVIAIWTWIVRHRSKSAEPVTDPTAVAQSDEKSR
jgi:hypothetical protein